MNQAKAKAKAKVKSILILEDYEPLSDSLAEILSIEGYKINYSYDGFSGIDMAKELLPDLIICSSQFKDIDCWEIILALRKYKPTRKVPFICISDNPLCDLSQKSRKDVTVLTKPFTVDQLLTSISSII